MKTSTTGFVVHSFDADAFGYLAPAALAGYLQEAAGQSADAQGFGLRDLNRQGLTWVLGREALSVDEPIRSGDTLEVETWPSGVERWAALRDFRVKRSGKEVGRALTTWFVVDQITRRPVRPNTVLPEQFHAPSAHVLPLKSEPLPAVEDATIERRFQVRFSDIDANLHVTHASYIAWVVESVHESDWRKTWLASLDIQFLAECTLGLFVRSRSASTREGAMIHSVTREQEAKEVARALTIWKPKQTTP